MENTVITISRQYGAGGRELAEILAGNDCKNRGTSCADQFSKAIDKALA